jgi:hypothetical protein
MTSRNHFVSTDRMRARLVVAAAAVAAGALAASVAQDALARTRPAPVPLARDEAFVVRLTRAVSLSRIQGGNLTVALTPGPGISDARGTWVQGRALIDPATGRAVVVRPEAVREYYELVKGLLREDAQAAAAQMLGRIERTGKVEPLAEVDAALRIRLGPNAGSRLDDDATPVSAMYPAQLSDVTNDGDDPLTYDLGDDPLEPYRTRIAGDDALWHAYYLGDDISGFAELAQNSEFERFHHTVEFSTGVPAESSVLRQREHRRVLVRRSSLFVTFMPSIPNRVDLADSGYDAGASYAVIASGPVRRKARTLLPERGGVLAFVKGTATFAVAPDDGAGGPFLGGTPWTGAPSAAAARVVNVTPPNGEIEVDPSTDWEDPDNQFTTPIPMRRKPVVRLRFSRPLDPRTVDAAHFTMTRTAVFDPFGNETPHQDPVAVDVVLAQSRLGEIRVELRPAAIFDPSSRFEVRVLATTRSLDGTPGASDFVSSFVTR